MQWQSPGDFHASSCPIILIIGLLLPQTLQAQVSVHASIKGAVFSADDLEPLPDAHVFIASSMIGTTTDVEGAFRLTRIPAGAIQLSISVIGFEPQIFPIFIRPGEERVFDIELQPLAYELGDVVVEAKRDRRWERQFKRFRRLFLGESPNAEATTILNPEVLAFEIEDGQFTASAHEPLLIENNALGYRTRFHLRDFQESRGAIRYQGESFYEALTPKDEAQENAWELRREEAYEGSLRHFLRSLIHDRLEEEQFQLLEHVNPQLPQAHQLTVEDLYLHHQAPGSFLEAQAFVHDGPDSLTKRLVFNKVVEVLYTGEIESEAFLRWQSYKYNYEAAAHQQSWVVLKNEDALVDLNGTQLDPYSLVLYGYLSFEAFADALPIEYGLASEGQ